MGVAETGSPVAVWGGKREGAGRPKVERKRKSRLVQFHDEEWDAIKEKAAKRSMSIREYLYFLVENDKILKG